MLELGAILILRTLRFPKYWTGYALRYTYADERGEPDRLHRNQVPEEVRPLLVDEAVVQVQPVD